MLTVKDRTVLNLIKSALTGEVYVLPEDFNITEYMDFASHRQIDAIIYYGAVNCGINPKDPQVRPAFKRTCGGVFIDEMQQEALKNIFAAFDKNGIDYMPLKGINLKKMYPKSDMRTMSDADILIRIEQYKKIENTMQELGYNFVTESDHEYIWENSSLVVELHKSLIPSYDKKLYEFFKNVWDKAERCEGGLHKLNKNDEFIHIFTHFAKHYRSGGIGIKHLTDLYVFKNSESDLDEKYIEKSLASMGLLEFYKNVCDAVTLAFDGKGNTQKAEFVLKTVLNSGTYGVPEKKNIWANVMNKNSKFRRIIRLTFPPRKNLQQKYPVLKKCGILLPVMWVVRIFDTILFNRHKIKNQQQKIAYATLERTDDYIKALEYVGFDLTEV